ncbi:MAG: hypothetical protein ACRDTH_12015 [Pseudonocardiaceae bacterium]
MLLVPSYIRRQRLLASAAVARRAERGNQAAALTWAAIAEVGLAGVLVVWLISPAAAGTAGYGFPVSMILLVVSILITAVGMGVLRVAPRLPRNIKLAMTLLIAATAGALIPLALTALFATGSGGYGFLLALAVIGMEYLAVTIPRAAHPEPP